MILAPPRSGKTFLVSELLLAYLNGILPKDIPSKIMAKNLSGWEIAKFPLFCNITNSKYRPYNGILWNRITTESPDKLKIKVGEHNFTYLYQQEDLKNIVVY